MQKVRTAGPLGYCFGVEQAIEKAVKYAEENGPLFSLGTLAHNEVVVEYLRQHQVNPVELEDIKPGMNVAITAHGAPPATFDLLAKGDFKVLDCTCPIVRKAQTVVIQRPDGFDIVIFGDKNHQEVIALDGWAGGAKFVGNMVDLFAHTQEYKILDLGPKIGIISQTTKIPSGFADFVTTLVNRHIEKFKEVRIYNTICPIVTTRLNEARKLSEHVDMMFIVGSQESANTRNLETVCKQGITASRGVVEPWAVSLVQDVDQVGDVLNRWIVENDQRSPKIGVTAGTSTPMSVVKEIVTKLKELLYDSESSI